MNNKDLYNIIYTENKHYNHNVMYKYEHVSRYFNNLGKNIKILDAGCGEGWNLNNLITEGFNAFGIEISDVCCKDFLQNLPHKCIDIISHSANNLYDAILCFDVLEHISHEDIYFTIEALAKMAPKALLGIAHHSDIQFGHELHLIQESHDWWEEKLKIYYSKVNFVDCLGGNFYLFECEV